MLRSVSRLLFLQSTTACEGHILQTGKLVSRRFSSFPWPAGYNVTAGAYFNPSQKPCTQTFTRRYATGRALEFKSPNMLSILALYNPDYRSRLCHNEAGNGDKVSKDENRGTYKSEYKNEESKDEKSESEEMKGSFYTEVMILCALAAPVICLKNNNTEDHAENSNRKEFINNTPQGSEQNVNTIGAMSFSKGNEIQTAGTSPSDLEKVIYQSRIVIKKFQHRNEVPGISVAVSIDGKTVWAEGFGQADLENDVPCTPESVFRLSSISKTITMVAVAKLWEEGKLDLDKPVQHYVPEFPEKTWKGEKVQITTRHLISHTSGIRHYDHTYRLSGHNTQELAELKDEEFYNKKHYSSVDEYLAIFKDHPLMFKPGGSKGFYSSYGWNLVGAVIERASQMPYEEYMRTVFDDLGLENTHFEKAAAIIDNRVRQYLLKPNEFGDNVIEHCPYIDFSYKYAAEGMLSNVLDLVKFGNVMVHSYNTDSRQTLGSSSSTSLPGYLKSDTVQQMWTPTAKVQNRDRADYGLGWYLDLDNSNGKVNLAFHTGAGCGGSGMLICCPSVQNFLPSTYQSRTLQTQSDHSIVIGILVNRHVRLNDLVLHILTLFSQFQKNLQL